MVANKHTRRNTADKTNKGRRTTITKTELQPDQTAAQAEPGPAEVAEIASPPTPESKTTETPVATDRPTREPDSTGPNQPTKEKKLSALGAAAKVLAESGQAMSCQELIAAMAAQGYWQSPKGRTPASTLYSALLRELQRKGGNARFVKAEPGKFRLRDLP